MNFVLSHKGFPGGGFKFYMFIPTLLGDTWGNDPIWRAYFFKWVETVKQPTTVVNIWVFPKIGVPQNGWLKKWKTLLKWDDLGVPLFSETSIYSFIAFGSGSHDGWFMLIPTWVTGTLIIEVQQQDYFRSWETPKIHVWSNTEYF